MKKKQKPEMQKSYPADHPAGETVVKDGTTFWMGTEVKPCSMCGVAAVCVDDCGEFGNEQCPRFGRVGGKS
jgi:hypothetical protein